MSNKERLLDNNERLLDIAEKLLKLTSGGADPVMREKGVNINELGTGYFYLDAKLEEGDAAAMGLPEKYGAEWVGAYVMVKGLEDYDREAFLHDWYDDSLWYASLDGSTGADWKEIFTGDAVPLDGSKAMTGDLSIEKSYPRLHLKIPSTGRSLDFLATDDYVEVVTKLNTTNYRGIRIKPETAELENSLNLHEIVGGAVENYKIYGEHNITKGTTDLTAGVSALKDGCIHLVHE